MRPRGARIGTIIILTLATGCGGGGTIAPPARSTAPPSSPPNPVTPELVALGQALFHDKELSGNRNISCSTCHGAASGSGDALSLSIGEGGVGLATSRTLGSSGRMIARNSQALWNTGVGFSSPFLATGSSGAPMLTQRGVSPPSILAPPGASGPASAVAVMAALNAFAASSNAGDSGYGGTHEGLFWDSRVEFIPFHSPEPLLDATTDPRATRVRAQLHSALATQALFPVVTADEMRGQPGTNEIADAPDDPAAWDLIMARLVGTNGGTTGGIQGYRDLFRAAYPNVAFGDLNFGHASEAIAAFVGTTFTATDTPFDAFVAGDQSALTARQVAGMTLFFGNGGCASCHAGVHFSDFKGHAIGVPQLGPGKDANGDDRGLASASGLAAESYQFITPTLRNVALTAPYMHDGCYATLADAVRHHADPAAALATYDGRTLRPDFAATLDRDPGRNAARLAAIDPLIQARPFSNGDVASLVDFLNALTDSGSAARAAAAKPLAVPSGLPVD